MRIYFKKEPRIPFSVRRGRTESQLPAGFLVVMLHGHLCPEEKLEVDEKVLAS